MPTKRVYREDPGAPEPGPGVEFRRVRGCPGLWAGEDGQIYSVQRGAMYRLAWRWGHRPRPCVFYHGRNIPVARAIAEAWSGRAGACVRHAYDPDPADNRPGNLAPGTPKSNAADRAYHRTLAAAPPALRKQVVDTLIAARTATLANRRRAAL